MGPVDRWIRAVCAFLALAATAVGASSATADTTGDISYTASWTQGPGANQSTLVVTNTAAAGGQTISEFQFTFSAAGVVVTQAVGTPSSCTGSTAQVNCGGAIAPGGSQSVVVTTQNPAPDNSGGSLKLFDSGDNPQPTVTVSGPTPTTPATCPGFPSFPEPPGCADVAITSFTINAATWTPAPHGGMELGPPTAVTVGGTVATGMRILATAAAANHGPDRADVTLSMTGSVPLMLPYGAVLDPSATQTVHGVAPGQNAATVALGGVRLRPGPVTIETASSGSIPDPDMTNNDGIPVTFNVVAPPVAKTSKPDKHVTGGGHGAVGGSADSCGEAQTPRQCENTSFICLENAGCTTTHHDICGGQGTDTVGGCVPPPAFPSCNGGCPTGQPVMASDVLMHSSDTAGGDPALEKVKTVRVALVHLGPGATVGHERKGCEWLKGRSAVKAGPCDSPVWQTARGTSAWSLAVGPLPKGKWIELVQPRDAAGYAEVTYSARDGNELAFTVR